VGWGQVEIWRPEGGPYIEYVRWSEASVRFQS